MATQAISGRLIPVEEYLRTGYDPDCEYDDGVVVERYLGEFEHSFLQAILATLFTNNMDTWGVFGLTEQRIQIKPRRFLIPDVSVLRLGTPREKILTRPPLIAIEILSPEDTHRKAASKAIEYLDFGIEHVWVIDPAARAGFLGTRNGLEPVALGELTVPGTPILVNVAKLFAQLDRM
jgi:Uma2 family endonuclease